MTQKVLEPVSRVIQTEARSEDMHVFQLVVQAFLRLIGRYALAHAHSIVPQLRTAGTTFVSHSPKGYQSDEPKSSNEFGNDFDQDD